MNDMKRSPGRYGYNEDLDDESDTEDEYIDECFADLKIINSLHWSYLISPNCNINSKTTTNIMNQSSKCVFAPQYTLPFRNSFDFNRSNEFHLDLASEHLSSYQGIHDWPEVKQFLNRNLEILAKEQSVEVNINLELENEIRCVDQEMTLRKSEVRRLSDSENLKQKLELEELERQRKDAQRRIDMIELLLDPTKPLVYGTLSSFLNDIESCKNENANDINIYTSSSESTSSITLLKELKNECDECLYEMGVCHPPKDYVGKSAPAVDLNWWIQQPTCKRLLNGGHVELIQAVNRVISASSRSHSQKGSEEEGVSQGPLPSVPASDNVRRPISGSQPPITNIDVSSFKLQLGSTPDYVSAIQTKKDLLRKVSSHSCQDPNIAAELGSDFVSRIRQIIQAISHLGEADLTYQNIIDTTSSDHTLSRKVETVVLSIAAECQELLREAEKIYGQRGVTCVVWEVLTNCLWKGTHTLSEELLILLVHICRSVIKIVPTAWSILSILLQICSPYCIPNICILVKPENRFNEFLSLSFSSEVGFGPEECLRLLVMYGLLVSSHTSSDVLGDAWTWLVRAGQQLTAIVEVICSSGSHGNTSSTSSSRFSTEEVTLAKKLLPVAYRSIRTIYRTVGQELLMYYRSPLVSLSQSFLKLLQRQSQSGVNIPSVGSTDSDLLCLLHELTTNSSLPRMIPRLQERHVLDAYTLKRFLESYKVVADAIDGDRSISMSARKKSVQISAPDTEIGKLRGTFNIIGDNVESQKRALLRLQQTVSQTARTNDKELLQHALYKISNQTILHCQTPHFITEKHATPFAHVVCVLCQESSVISDLVRAQFLSNCPLLIPIFELDTDVSPDEYRSVMGYRQAGQNASTGESEWEPTDKWMERMAKLLGTFAVMAINNGEQPFSLEDVWMWLARTINYCGSKKPPPMMTAKILDTVLRVASDALLSAYRDPFCRLLKILRSDLVDQLDGTDDAMSERQRLRDYLDNTLASVANQRK